MLLSQVKELQKPYQIFLNQNSCTGLSHVTTAVIRVPGGWELRSSESQDGPVSCLPSFKLSLVFQYFKLYLVFQYLNCILSSIIWNVSCLPSWKLFLVFHHFNCLMFFFIQLSLVFHNLKCFVSVNALWFYRGMGLYAFSSVQWWYLVFCHLYFKHPLVCPLASIIWTVSCLGLTIYF